MVGRVERTCARLYVINCVFVGGAADFKALKTVMQTTHALNMVG